MTPGLRWTRVTPTASVPLREGRVVNLGGRDIALFNLGGRFAAIDNQCPHQGGPLCDGIVSGTSVVCPLHGWKFDLDTGYPVLASSPTCLTTYPTRVEDGLIFVGQVAE